jgi:hypothetical protein
MSKGLTRGAVLPEFTVADENGEMYRLSKLQGDDAMIMPFQLWEDLQDLLRRTKADFDPTSAQARAEWKESESASAGVSGHA